MKKIFISIMLMLVVFTVTAEKQTVRLYIADMECKACQAKVEKTLSFERGVKKLEFDIEHRQVTIVFDDNKTSISTLQAALLKYNKYTSQVVIDYKTNTMCPYSNESCCKKSSDCKH